MLLLQSPGVATSDYNYPFHRETQIFSVLNKVKTADLTFKFPSYFLQYKCLK